MDLSDLPQSAQVRIAAAEIEADSFLANSPAYFAGHSDFSTTRRYVHPNLEAGREAMERARGVQGGHNIGHSPKNAVLMSEAEETRNLM